MPRFFAPRIDQASIAPMHRGEGCAQPVFILGHQNGVNVVGHQTISPAGNPRLLATGGEKIAKSDIISLVKENLLPPIATLGDVMGKAGNDKTSDAGHGLRLEQGGDRSQGVKYTVTVIRN